MLCAQSAHWATRSIPAEVFPGTSRYQGTEFISETHFGAPPKSGLRIWRARFTVRIFYWKIPPEVLAILKSRTMSREQQKWDLQKAMVVGPLGSRLLSELSGYS